MYRYYRSLAAVIVLLLSSTQVLGDIFGDQYFDYDEDLAKLSVVYSSAAYDRNPAVGNWSFDNPECNEQTAGFVLNETYVGDGTEAFSYVGLDTVRQMVVVAFKGTSDLRDWMTDLQTWVRYTARCAPGGTGSNTSGTAEMGRKQAGVEAAARVHDAPPLTTAATAAAAAAAAVVTASVAGYEEEEGRQQQQQQQQQKQDELIGNVHFGFCEYYQSIVAQGLADRAALLARQNPTYTVLVTGHSLGAAAAAVCAADLTQRMLVESERVVLYTLGEPRTGDGIFAEGLHDRVGTAYRVVHNKDIVPHLALCCHGWFGKCRAGEVSCPYQHSTEIVYANDMSPGAPWLMCNDTIGEDYACDPQSWDLSVSDHQHYFERLVGTYCATVPGDEEIPFSVMQQEEEFLLTFTDAAMRRKEPPYGSNHKSS